MKHMKGKGLDEMQMYEILREGITLELATIIKADSLEGAKQKAVEMGYDAEYYRVQEYDPDAVY